MRFSLKTSLLNFTCFSLLLLILATVLFGCAASKKPSAYRALTGQEAQDLKAILESSGTNRAELQKALQLYPPQSPKAKEARFLITNLPPSDRSSMRTRDLREIIDYAHLAKKTFSWGPGVPVNIFRHFVLPHRVAQEPFQPCRASFYKQLAPLVSNCTAQEAVARVNRWCGQKTSFQSTSRWDQGPLSTIKRGIGRCEEAVILCVLALRSVGIPARAAGTPAWQHTDDNHVWTEVWIKGSWYALEAAQPYQELTKNRLRAPLVRSVVYGHVPESAGPIISKGFGATVLNRTSSYMPTWQLNINVKNKHGKPLSEAELFVSVFNYACFRPLARLKTDQQGRASISLGQGSFLLTISHAGQNDYALVTNLQPQKRRTLDIKLELQKNRLFSGQVQLPFYSRAMQERLQNGYGISLFPSLRDKELQARDQELYQRRLQGIETLVHNLSQNPRYQDVFLPLKSAGLNAPLLGTVLENSSDLKKSIDYLDQLQAKDLVCLSYQQALQEPLLAQESRSFAIQEKLNYDNSTYTKFVLNPRVEYEPLSYWRPLLQEKFTKAYASQVSQTPKRINNFVAALRDIERGFFGSLMTPGELLQAEAGIDRSKCILACAALRSTGIPARYNPEQDFVQYKTGKDWKPLFPNRPELLGQTNATEQSSHYYAPAARIEIHFLDKEKELSGAELDYFKDFSIARFTDQGYFRQVRESIKGSFAKDSKTCRLLLPAGQYWLFAAQRNKHGEALVSAVQFEAQSGKKLKIKLQLDKQ